MSQKNKKQSPGCISTIFRYLILFCIIALIIDLIKTHISARTKHNIIITGAALVVIAVFIMIFKVYRKLYRKYTLKQLDSMDGHSFEYACADILKSNGFKHVQVTKGSGDFGVDITAEKDKIKYAIQCKCYSHKLNNTPIQEVVGGLAYYGCTKGAVMTNQYFTASAKKLTQVNNVELWDRNAISSMLEQKKSENYALKTTATLKMSNKFQSIKANT